MRVVFGESEKLESFFKIPQFLYGDFSVFGVDRHCEKAVEFVLERLKENQRIEVLVLLNMKLDLKENHLKTIQSFGTKIYFFLTTQKKIPTLEVYKKLAENGILFLYKI
ncbi:hypothetical protein IP364_05795 [Helicobacter winghamensis]|uniref:hypothetical protein n=1 Tax=Helicobacter winghamensis TaxID=157268 RepID=UPI00242EAFA3|nr:hypothetical protein [Helicobacter winghamensis]